MARLVSEQVDRWRTCQTRGVRRSSTRRQAALVRVPLAVIVVVVLVLLRARHDVWAMAVAVVGFLVLELLDRLANRSGAADHKAKGVR